MAAGCATVSSSDTYTYIDLSQVTPQTVTNNVESQSRLFENFSSSGYGDFETPQGNYSARFDISISRPSWTYIRIYGPFGMKVAQIKLSSDSLIVYNSFQNELFIGKPTAENLRRFLMVAPDCPSLPDANGPFARVTDMLLGLMSPPIPPAGASPGPDRLEGLLQHRRQRSQFHLRHGGYSGTLSCRWKVYADDRVRSIDKRRARNADSVFRFHECPQYLFPEVGFVRGHGAEDFGKIVLRGHRFKRK